jgi:preprotein translocase subunit SecG
MFTTLIVFQVLLAASLIAIVLVQRGPGATMGAAFGAGASGTVFGSRGAGNFLTRTTGWLAVGFFGISLTLAVLATGLGADDESESALADSVVEQQTAEQETEAALDSALERLDEQAEPPGGEAAEPSAEDAGGGETPAAADAAAASADEAAGDEEQDGSQPDPPRSE